MGMLSKITNRINRQGRLMAGMMERLDVSLESVAGDACGQQIERVARACVFCRHGEACYAWQMAHADGASQAPGFCPNSAFWAAHRRVSRTETPAA